MRHVFSSEAQRRKAMKKTLIIFLAIALLLAIMPTMALAAGETVTITNAAELMAAIVNQDDNQTWNIAAGVYDIDRNNSISGEGQTGWYFPIVADGITIIGAGIDQTVITSTVFSENGNWSSQNMITVFSDNVTVQDLTVRPKMDTNKAIEILGMNVTLKNIAIRNNNILTHESYLLQKGVAENSSTDYWEAFATMFAGSVFFNPQNAQKDIGTATLDNVLVTQAWISCSANYVDNGTLILTNGTTVDFRNSWFAGYDTFGVISKNPKLTYDVIDFTVIYDETASLQPQILDRVPSGTTLIGEQDTEVTAGIDPSYMIIIPAAVDFGALIKDTGVQVQDFPIQAVGVVLEPGCYINVDVAGPFTMLDQNGSGTIPLNYNLSNESGLLTPPSIFATFTADDTENGTVSVDTSAITAAGSYKGTMNFTISYH